MTPSGYRDSVRVYDQRNRLVQVWGPTAGTPAQAVGPHEVRAYDNLDRLVERGLFSQLPTPAQGGNQDALIAANGTNRLLYSRISYDSMPRSSGQRLVLRVGCRLTTFTRA